MDSFSGHTTSPAGCNIIVIGGDIYRKDSWGLDGLLPPFLSSQARGRIAGYTLASASVYLGDLPARHKKKLPRHPAIPVVRMGRLAVDRAFKSQGLGGALLADALTRVIRSEIAAYTFVGAERDVPKKKTYGCDNLKLTHLTGK